MKKILVILLLITSGGSLFAESRGYHLFKDAFNTEKQFPVLAVALYEQALTAGPEAKLKNTILGRLYFLYGKTGKYAGFFRLRKKYAALPFVRHDKKLLQNIAGSVHLAPDELERIVSACQEKKTEAVQSALENHRDNRGLHLLVLALVTENPDPEFLDRIYSNGTSPFPETKIVALIKTGNKRAIGLIYSHMPETALAAEKGKYLYLLGMHLRSRKKNQLASRFFMMSSSYAAEFGGVNEAAKSLIATGRFKEACSLPVGGFREDSESDVLLQLFCSGKLKKMKNILQPVLDSFFEKEKFGFYKKLAGAF